MRKDKINPNLPSTENYLIINTLPTPYIVRAVLDEAKFRNELGQNTKILDLSRLSFPILSIIQNKKRFKLGWFYWWALNYLKVNQWGFSKKISKKINVDFIKKNRYFVWKLAKYSKKTIFEKYELSHLIESLWLDASRGGQIETNSYTYKKIVKQLIRLVIKIEKILSTDEFNNYECWIVTNGRFPVDHIAKIYGKSKGKKIMFLEGNYDGQRVEIFNVSPHSLSERKQKILQSWEESKSNKKRLAEIKQALKLIAEPPTYSKAEWNWHIYQQAGYLRDLPDDKELITFFCTSEGEMSSSVLDENPIRLEQDQIKAIDSLISKIDFNKFHLVIKEHPNFSNNKNVKFSKLKIYLSKLEKVRNKNNITIIYGNEKDSSYELIIKSSLVAVYNSTLAVTAICLSKPVLVYGSPYFALSFRSKLKNINKLTSATDYIHLKLDKKYVYPWLAYQLFGGRRIELPRNPNHYR